MHPETSEPFGQLLRAARLDAGLTQEALAERAGVSVRAIQSLERGRNTPHHDTVQRLGAALGLAAGALSRFEAAALPRPRHRPVPSQEPLATRQPELPPTNVPLQVTGFVGRAHDIAQVTALLDETRLLTLVGTGGVGKTRLALQVAAGVRERYQQGVWLVELARLTGSALVPQAVAATLGVPDDPARAPLDVLVATLRSRHMLLILDNCEHVLDACARLAATLLHTCPHVQILATSREPLMAAGETLWHVAPLSLPDVDQQAGPSELLRSEAVRLFVARTRALQQNFALTAANAPTVATICRCLDGIPLALELAAARVRSLGVEQLAARLDERFRLLTGGQRTALPHQQTLRAMVDWSYDLLTAQERLLFERLAVFAGSFTVEAAEAVCAGGELAGTDVLDLLLRLVDKSLVMVEERQTLGYRLLDTLRHYGQARLAERGEATAMCAAHATYYVSLAEQAEPELFRAQQVAWADRLDGALDDIRAALCWCLDEAKVTQEWTPPAAEWSLRLVGGLWWFWYIRMHRWEGITWMERALRQPTPASPGRAQALLGIAQLVWTAGEQIRGKALFEEGVAVAQALSDTYPLIMLLAWYGHHLRGTHGHEHDEAHDALDYERGTAMLHESLALAWASGERALAAHPLLLLAYSADMGREDERRRARAEAEESLALATEAGHLFGIAAAQRVLGRIALQEGDLARARTAFSAELATMQQLGDAAAIAMALSSLGDVARLTGDRAGAVAFYEQSLGLYRSIDYDRDLMARVLRRLGDLALGQGNDAAAFARYAESLVVAQQAQSQGQTAATLESLGTLAAERAQPMHALRLLAAAAGLRRRADLTLRPEDQATLDRVLGRVGAMIDIAGRETAWAEGQALTPEQAVAYALDWDERMEELRQPGALLHDA